jgi:hypothetical protein
MKEEKMKQTDFQPPAGFDRMVGHFLPGGIATDFICLPASFTAGETLVLFENRRTSAVVIRRVVAGRPPHSKKNIAVIGQARADVSAPLPGEPSCTLFFEVQSGSPGACELWVAFCRGPLSLVTLKLKPQAAIGKPQEEGARLKAASEATPPSGPPARINIMRVYLGENGGKIRYRYTLWLDALGVDQEYESPEFAGDIETILQPYMNLFDQVETADKTDFEQLQIELRSIGARLFQTLFPSDLQSVFWENRDRITHLKLYCEEPYIPWEILHVCEPGKSLPSETRFLGQMGLVRWLYGHTAPTELRCGPAAPGTLRLPIPATNWRAQKKKESF